VIPVQVALLSVLFAPQALPAAPITFLSPRAGETLRAGQVVEIRFQGVPDEIDEVELLLVSGRNRRLVLRLTESLEPAAGSFDWTVPALSMPDARLVLRMGLNGREVESEPSGVFAIESFGSAATASLSLRNGELWVGDGDHPDRDIDDSLPGGALNPDPARVTAWSSTSPLSLPRLDPDLPAPVRGPAVTFADTSASDNARVSTDLTRAPLVVPQRI
jgi:hypothetical protein